MRFAVQVRVLRILRTCLGGRAARVQVRVLRTCLGGRAAREQVRFLRILRTCLGVVQGESHEMDCEDFEDMSGRGRALGDAGVQLLESLS